MRIRTTLGIAVLTAAAAGPLVLAAPASAADTPPATGCPAGNEVLSVADLTARGYRVPALVDAQGNQNGLVCAKPYAEPASGNLCDKVDCTVEVIYLFRDDDLTR